MYSVDLISSLIEVLIPCTKFSLQLSYLGQVSICPNMSDNYCNNLLETARLSIRTAHTLCLPYFCRLKFLILHLNGC